MTVDARDWGEKSGERQQRISPNPPPTSPGRVPRRAGTGARTGATGRSVNIFTNIFYTSHPELGRRRRKYASNLPKASVFRLRPGPHTYTGSEAAAAAAAAPRGNSGSAGKASESEEGVAACALAKSEQNIPAMQPIPWLAPPRSRFFSGFVCFFFFLFI